MEAHVILMSLNTPTWLSFVKAPHLIPLCNTLETAIAQTTSTYYQKARGKSKEKTGADADEEEAKKLQWIFWEGRAADTERRGWGRKEQE